MKKTVMIAALAALSGSAMAADLGLSINVGQPGFFGQIDIGDAPPPPPALIMPRPVVIHRDRGYDGGPIYLHVPPGYERNWGRHCAEYNACGRPVYFVRDEWYRGDYVPRYQARHVDEGRREEERRGEEQRAQEQRMQERRAEDKRDERRDERHDAQNERRDDHDRDH